MKCPSCGVENRVDARFCDSCGTALAAPAQERRKLATLLFCDVSGSTAMGERLDAESVRELMFRYFHQMRDAIEGHGGTVEKFVGDAVLAVFGVPVAHEDDAARAVRAALEMRARLEELNGELAQRFGSSLALRIGLNTGEVVAGDPAARETFVTGDPVNTAARLEQHAAPGEILLGELTARLSGAQVEPVEPIAAKGKAEPVPAFRLLGTAERRRPERPLLGRAQELAKLRALFDRADGQAVIASVVGEPGVGKTRLVSEFVSGVPARVLAGRCLAYGESITYWPLAEIVRDAAGIRDEDSVAEARAKIEWVWAPEIARVLAAISGLGGSVVVEEVPWAFSRAVAALAQERPLVLVVEDVHWAEDALLELLDGVERVEAPVLLLATARPEQPWREAVRLDPLAGEDIEALLAGEPDRERIAVASGGNPLFAEELAAYLRERPGAAETPPTLAALLTARLDLLDARERGAAERGSVEGEVFHRGAVEALSPGADVRHALEGLAARDWIHPAQASYADEAAFRFKHALVRDAAYNGTAKRLRIQLHEGFASWLEARAGHRLEEVEEILGYHLEQACRYRDDLGLAEPAVAEQAGAHLAVAGRRALWRGDSRSALPLLDRALELTRPLRLDVHLELDLATTYFFVDDEARAHELAESAARRADATGDALGAALARVGSALFAMSSGGLLAVVDEQAHLVLPQLEAAEDHAGLVHVWRALERVADARGRNEEQAHAAEQALHHARLAGEHRNDLFTLTKALVLGPRPVQDALTTLDNLPAEITHPTRTIGRAVLTAMLGDAEAWPLGLAASQRLDEYGAGRHEPALAEIAMYLGEHDRSVAQLRTLLDDFERWEAPTGARGWVASLLGHSLCLADRHDEAEGFGQIGREHAPDDVLAQALWRLTLALVHSHRGEHDAAEQLARESIAVLEPTDLLNWQGMACWGFGEVLAAAGRAKDAAAAYEEAIRCFGRKGNVAMATQVRPRLEALRAESPA